MRLREEKKQSKSINLYALPVLLFLSIVILAIVTPGLRDAKAEPAAVDVQAQTTITIQQLAIDQLTAENKEAATKIQALTDKSKAVNAELLKMQAETKGLTTKVTDLQKKLDSSTAELKKVQNTLKELGLPFQ